MADTARWNLPLLDAGQAQKEMTVNEAFARIDVLAQAAVTAIGVNVAPAAPAEGQAWVVGDAPEGVWAGHAKALAGWTAGGWRFVAPRDGMSVWSAADGCPAVFSAGSWRVGRVAARTIEVGGRQVVGAQAAAIAAPAGGATVDAEARSALTALLAALRTHGLIAA